MPKHMTIINLACTITKLRKWGQAWKYSAESAQNAASQLTAEHERKLTEHRAAFGARTKADAETIDRLHTERDALRAEVADLKTQLERLTSWAAKNQAARETLQTELETLKSQASKHPVKVGGIQLGDKLRLVKQPPGWSAQWGKTGDVATVSEDNGIVFKMDTGYTWPLSCIEFVTEATHDTPEGRSVVESVIRNDRNTEPRPGDTVRLVRIPSRSDVSPKLQTTLEWPWIERWGTLNQTALVVEPAYQLAGAVSVCLSANVHARWPICCVEVVRTEPDEIKVGDVAKVRSASGNLTAKCDVGQIGEVLKIDSRDGTVLLSGEAGWVDIQDVRKVTT